MDSAAWGVRTSQLRDSFFFFLWYSIWKSCKNGECLCVYIFDEFFIWTVCSLYVSRMKFSRDSRLTDSIFFLCVCVCVPIGVWSNKNSTWTHIRLAVTIRRWWCVYLLFISLPFLRKIMLLSLFHWLLLSSLDLPLSIVISFYRKRNNFWRRARKSFFKNSFRVVLRESRVVAVNLATRGASCLSFPPVKK